MEVDLKITTKQVAAVAAVGLPMQLSLLLLVRHSQLPLVREVLALQLGALEVLVALLV